MYAMSLTIDSINIMFAELQAKSLLIIQQEILVQNLFGRIIAMFGIKIVMSHGDGENRSLRVSTMAIVHHIENQGSFSRDHYHRLETADQKDVVNHITKYMLVLLVGLQFVKAEQDGTNCASEKDAPHVMPVQLVKLRHGQFLNEVLDLFRKHVFKIWSDKNIKQIEVEHRELLKLYNIDTIMRNMINNHNNKTTFNNA